MARFVEGEYERKYAAEENRLAEIHSKAIESFGESLGTAFFEYAYGGDIDSHRPYSEKEVRRDWSGKRMEFARAIVETLENGTTKEKVQALTALLQSLESQIAPVQIVAEDDYWSQAPID